MKTILLCAVLAFAERASGQTTYTYTTDTEGQPPLPTAQSELPNSLPGVVIESWHHDPVQKTVTLHLVNRSNKDATAFNISIAERYADGSTDYADGRPNDIHDHQIMEDMLAAMVSDPVSAALNELLPYTESLDAKTKNGSPEVAENNVARNLRGDIRNLQYMQRDKITREFLARYVEYQEKQIALLKPHANLSVNLTEVR